MPADDPLPPWWGAQLNADLDRIFRTHTNPHAAEHDAANPTPEDAE